MSTGRPSLNRRRFLQNTAAGIGAVSAAGALSHAAERQSAETQPAVDPDQLIWRNRRPGMEYTRMGRTHFMVSQIVAGVVPNEILYRRMLSRGLNYFDTARGYANHEVELRDVLKKHRDKVWVTSKATDVAGYAKIDEEVEKLYRQAMKSFIHKSDGNLLDLHNEAVKKQKETGEKPDLRPVGKRIADLYARKLDESLERMGIDMVDCYMVHGIEIPWIFQCHELWAAYEKAHKAGKVKHFGHSTHKHVKEVLAATIEANEQGPWKIDLIMPAVNPGSFDDPAMNLKEELAGLKKQDVGIVAMKTTGVGEAEWQEKEKNLGAIEGLHPIARKKLWILKCTDHLIDAVIVAVKNNEILDESFSLPGMKLSAADRRRLEAIVKREMSGLCHLCGNCETICPEHIAVTDMVRYHAYIHQYDEKELARELYTAAGYDPAGLCSHCGRCREVCPSNLPVTDILNKLSLDMHA